MQLAGIVFDFDGLVLDTEWVTYVSIAEVFTEHGTELDIELWRSFIGTTDHPHWTEILGEQLGREVDHEALAAERQRRSLADLEALLVQPGVIELIDDAEAAGLPLAIASSSPREWVRGHLERHGLLDRFTAVHTGDEVELTKPAPELYTLAVTSLGIAPATAVAIEDSVNGCVAAKAAGLAVVAVPSTLTKGRDFGMADLVVDSVADLDLSVLDALVG